MTCQYLEFQTQFRVARPDHFLALKLDVVPARASLVDVPGHAPIHRMTRTVDNCILLPDAVRLSAFDEVRLPLEALLEALRDDQAGRGGHFADGIKTEMGRVLPPIVARLEHSAARGGVWSRWQDWLSEELDYVTDPAEDPWALTDFILQHAISLDAYIRQGRYALFDLIRAHLAALPAKTR